jgi:tetratricopeptide (TPR) repeat protein
MRITATANEMVTKLFQVIIFSLIIAYPVIAKESASDVENLIATNQWEEAAKLMFREARAIDRHEPSIVTGQARAGFIRDALETIEGTHPSSRSWLLMTVVKEAPSLPSDKRDELIRNALAAARAQRNRISDNYLRSGDLVRIALYYSAQGSENDAKAVFSEAVTSAEAGLLEEGSGGFRQITEQMRTSLDGEVKPWMISILQSSLSKVVTNLPSLVDVVLSMIRNGSTKVDKNADIGSLAFACIDLVAVAGRLESRDQVPPFIECATSSIAKIGKTSRKRHASEALDKAEAEAGYSIISSDSPIVESMREARAGNIEKSYQIVVSEFGENLYVDHRLAAYEKIYNDAIKRGDLKTALYYAERPVRQLPHHEISVWRQLAEKQIEMGDRTSASDSYRKALSTLDKLIASPQIYDSGIAAIVNLAESMLRNGMQDEGRRTLLLYQLLLERISEKQMLDRTTVSISVSKSFWRIGMKTEAKKLIQQAYSYAHSYDTNKLHGDMDKARLLAFIAQTISSFPPVQSS